jgi:hypothetical protein
MKGYNCITGVKAKVSPLPPWGWMLWSSSLAPWSEISHRWIKSEVIGLRFRDQHESNTQCVLVAWTHVFIHHVTKGDTTAEIPALCSLLTCLTAPWVMICKRHLISGVTVPFLSNFRALCSLCWIQRFVYKSIMHLHSVYHLLFKTEHVVSGNGTVSLSGKCTGMHTLKSH